jgi:hypothetical protein
VVFSFTKTEWHIYNEKEEMIYLRHTTEEQVIFIPKSTERPDAWKVFLHARSLVSSDNFSIDGIVENSSALYYPMRVRLADSIASGEYEYTLSDDMGVLSTGLMVIGDTIKMKEYNTTIEYEQYRKS